MIYVVADGIFSAGTDFGGPDLHGTARQRDRHDHREQFRGRADRQRHGKREAFKGEAVPQKLREKNQQDQESGQVSQSSLRAAALVFCKTLQLFDIDKLHAAALRQLDQAKRLELGEGAAHGLDGEAKEVTDIGAGHR